MNFEGKEFTAYNIPTNNTHVLIIGAPNGFIACGYINIDTANRVGDTCAIVTGVKTPDDMLDAKIVAVSQEALKLGIKKGMRGKEALLLMS